jgi:hypothetical protein
MVQGKTMAQWERESQLNVERELRGESHVHPTPSDPPTPEEQEAFIYSLTPYEKARALGGGPLGELAAVAALIDILRLLLEDDNEN